jgi:hypothetical protein
VSNNAPSLPWGQAVEPNSTLTLFQQMQALPVNASPVAGFSTPSATQRPLGVAYAQHPQLHMVRDFLSKVAFTVEDNERKINGLGRGR